MKNVTILFLLTILLENSFSQVNIDTYNSIFYRTGIVNKSTAKKAKLKTSKECMKYYSDEGKIYSDKCYHENFYNIEGYLVQTTDLNSFEGRSKIDKYRQISYDKNGNEISEIYGYIYDSLSNLSQKTIMNYPNGKIGAYELYYYDKNRNVIKTELYSLNELEYQQNYKYNKYNKLVEEEFIQYVDKSNEEGGSSKGTSIYKYKYDSNNLLTEIESFDKIDDKLISKQIQKIIFDSVLSTITIETGYLKDIYYLNNRGLVDKVIDSLNNKIVMTTYYEYTYY